ncbi:MAG: hypothetical protein IT371_05750 [Deltaproteobacteria bacterium]|nr:hypothetical protein [Deltaproteobacteria bacterium]
MEASLPDLYRVQEEARRSCDAVIKRVNFAALVGHLRDEVDTDAGPVVTLLVRSVPEEESVGASATTLRDPVPVGPHDAELTDTLGASESPRHWLDHLDAEEDETEAAIYVDAHYGRPDALVVHTTLATAWEGEDFAAALEAAAASAAPITSDEDCAQIVDTLAGWQDVLAEISVH